MGFDRLLYGMTRFRTQAWLGDPKDMLILSNHPDDYVQAYVNERMFVSAPMTAWAVNNVGAMSWSMVTEMEGELTNEQREILQLNRKFGVLAGYTISFPAPSPRQKAAIGLTRRDRVYSMRCRAALGASRRGNGGVRAAAYKAST